MTKMTALDVIQAAYSLIGIFDQTSPLTPFETQLGLTTLADLLDTWDNQNLLVYATTPYTFPFQNGIQTYQVGPLNPFVCNILNNTMTVISGNPTVGIGNCLIAPGVPANVYITGIVTGNEYTINWTAPGPITQVNAGLCSYVAPTTNTMYGASQQDYNWNIPRPVKIEKISIQYPGEGNSPVEIEIPLIPLEEWVGVPQKNTPSLWPLFCYDDDSFPFRNLRFWPIPAASANCTIYAWDQLGMLSGLDQQIFAPPGYAMAIKLTLAEYLAFHFERVLTPDFKAKALSARNAIDNINEGIPTTRYDSIWGGHRGNNWAAESRGRVRI